MQEVRFLWEEASFLPGMVSRSAEVWFELGGVSNDRRRDFPSPPSAYALSEPIEEGGRGEAGGGLKPGASVCERSVGWSGACNTRWRWSESLVLIQRRPALGVCRRSRQGGEIVAKELSRLSRRMRLLPFLEDAGEIGRVPGG